MSKVEELRAKAMASMASSSRKPNPNPNIVRPSKSPQAKEDGEISSSSDGDLLGGGAATRSNTVLVQNSPVVVASKQSEKLVKGSIVTPNSSSKFVAAAQHRAGFRKDYRKQMKQFPGKVHTQKWSPATGSDNLVISFSDDNSETESEDSQSEENTKNRSCMHVSERFKSSTPSSKPDVLSRTHDNIKKKVKHGSHVSRSSLPYPEKVQGYKSSGPDALFRVDEIQTQKHHLSVGKSPSQDQVHVGAVLLDKKLQTSEVEIGIQAELTRENLQKERKRNILSASGELCQPSGLNFESTRARLDKCLELTTDGPSVKRLKCDDSFNSRHASDNTYLRLSFSPEKSSSDIKIKEPPDSSCHKGSDVLDHNHTKEFSSGHKDIESALSYGQAKIVQGSSGGVLSGADTGISPKINVLDKRIMQVGDFPISNQCVQFQQDTSCAEDAALCRGSTRNLEPLSGANIASHFDQLKLPAKGVADVETLMKVEEIIDRDLEEAQELRHRCEVEERLALKAFRRAQKALMDADIKCSFLKRKRELCSAQLQDAMMSLSDSHWPSSWRNKGEVISNSVKSVPRANDEQDPSLRLQSLGREQLDVMDCEHIRVANNAAQPYQHIVGDTQDSGRDSKLEASKSHPNSDCTRNVLGDAVPGHVSTEKDHQMVLLNSSSNQQLTNGEDLRERMVSIDGKLEKATENIEDYELEATLRSKLFARLGHRVSSDTNSANIPEPYEKSGAFALEEMESTSIDASVRLSNKLLQEEEKGGFSVGHPSYPSKDVSFCGELCGNADDRGIQTQKDLSFSLPTLFSNTVAKHIKFILPEPSILLKGFQGIDHYNDTPREGVADEDADFNQIVLLKLSNSDVCSSYLKIDPFRPFCMFDLRGKCNDEKCLWQHLRDCTSGNQKHIGYSSRADSDGPLVGSSTFGKHSVTSKLAGRHSNVDFVPEYYVGSDVIKAEQRSSGHLLLRSNWQFWQLSSSGSFRLPFPTERVLSVDAPTLHDYIGQADDGYLKVLPLHLQNERSITKHNLHGSANVEQSLELAIDLFNMKSKKFVGREKALSLLSRSLEANPHSIALWVVYLNIYYRKEKDVGEDDMFHQAVQNNKGSYELWLMFINSRFGVDHRIHAYDDAITALCRRSKDRDKDSLSSCILDIFVQMLDFLQMSGNVDHAISRIRTLFGIPTEADHADFPRLSEFLSCLVFPDRCIFCICCIYVIFYKKIPEIIVQQIELVKDLPFEIEWPHVRLTNQERHQAVELMRRVVDDLDLDANFTSNGSNLYERTVVRSAHFLAVSHVRFVEATEGLKSTCDLLSNYMKKYPTCIELILLSAGCWKILKNEFAFDKFEHALRYWPKPIPGLHQLWSRYAEYALECKSFELAKDLMNRWFCSFCKVENSGCKDDMGSRLCLTALPTLSLGDDGFFSDQEDIVFGYLNLFLHYILQKETVKAHFAIKEALRQASPEHFKHCIREHAAFLHSCNLDSVSTAGTLTLLRGYARDARFCALSPILSRGFLQDIKKPRVAQLIENLFGSVSRDCSLFNSVLEECYGPSFLPKSFDKPKDLVDYAESLMEMTPANYSLAIQAHKFAASSFELSGVASAGIMFWASSLLANSILQAYPIAPEAAWLEAASLLSVLKAPSISERFHQQALMFYPLSIKLWNSYYYLSKILGNTESVVKSAKERGLKLG